VVDHFLLLCWDAVLIAVFFAFLWKEDGPARKRFIVKALLIMVLGAVALGWLMYPFPS
jgi:hypothetical protein